MGKLCPAQSDHGFPISLHELVIIIISAALLWVSLHRLLREKNLEKSWVELLKQNEKCIQTILNVIFFVELMTAKEIQCYDYQPKFLHVRHQYGHMGIWKLSYYYSQLIRYWGMKDKNNLLTINNMEKRHMIFRLAITMWPMFISCNIIFLLNVGLHFRWLLLPRCGEIQKIVPKSQIKGVQGIYSRKVI